MAVRYAPIAPVLQFPLVLLMKELRPRVLRVAGMDELTLVRRAAAKRPRQHKEPSRPKLLRDDVFVIRLCHFVDEIAGSLDVLDDTVVYLQRAPRGIPRERYARYHFEHYIQQIYILRNRLRVLCDWLARAYRKTALAANVSATAGDLKTKVDACLASVIEVRGAHVHEEQVHVAELYRLTLLKMLPATSKTKLQVARAETQVKESALNWVISNNAVAATVVDSYFATWLPLLFEPTGALRYPSPGGPGGRSAGHRTRGA